MRYAAPAIAWIFSVACGGTAATTSPSSDGGTNGTASPPADCSITTPVEWSDVETGVEGYTDGHVYTGTGNGACRFQTDLCPALAAALADPDIVAIEKKETQVALYGADSTACGRATDLLRIHPQHPEGYSLANVNVGADCALPPLCDAGAATCVAIPPGVQRLMDLLHRIDRAAQAAEPTCRPH
jgi:hypothetical protein